MILRVLPVVAYVALMWWYLSTEDEKKTAELGMVQRLIKYHRRKAEWHGRQVIALETHYKEVVA